MAKKISYLGDCDCRFGMRFLFPIAVVSVFAKINPVEVGKIAFTNSSLYAHYLHQTHAPIVTFGGAFLMMLFMHYFFNCEKTVHWICPVEKAMCKLDKFKGIEAIITGLMVLAVHFATYPHYGWAILKSGLIGILIYEAINFIYENDLEDLVVVTEDDESYDG